MNGFQALIPGGRQRLNARLCLHSKAIKRTRISFILEAGKLKRKGILVLGPAIHPVIAHLLAILEIEHHQAHHIGIGIKVRNLQSIHRAAFHRKLTGSQHGTILTKERSYGIYPALTAPYASLNAFRGIQDGIPGHEEALCFFR